MQIKNQFRVLFDLKLFKNIIELISYLNKSTKKKLIIIISVMFLNSFAELITIGSLMPIINIAFNPKGSSNIKYLNTFFDILNIQQNYQFIALSFLFLIIILSSALFRIFALKLINDYSETMSRELGKKLYRGILYQDYTYYLNTNSSLLISTLIQQLDIAIFIVALFLNAILCVFNILGILISLSIINFKIVLFITLTFSILYLFASNVTKKYTEFYGKVAYELRVKIIKIVKESLGFFRQIILDDSQDFFVEEYNKDNSKFARANSILTTIQAIPRVLIEVLILSLFVIFLNVMVINKVNLSSFLPIFGAFLLGIQKLLPLFQKLFSSYFSFNQNKYSLYSVVSFLKDSRKSEFNLRNKPFNMFDFKYRIRFENISFSYKNNMVLQNINYEIRKGDVIGIVGKTGAGKSTFIDLLMGLHEPNEGYIYIDDKKMNPYLFKEFRLSVTNVPQDYFLLDRSIEENIVFPNNKKNIDYKLLKNVLKIAMLEDFISNLKYGLQTHVGEDGIKLSGGQKQRIAIARALYKKHSFLLLDEATSSVDLFTEKKIINNIIKNKPDITIIMIAHRLETLKTCDYILEIKDKKFIRYNNIKDYSSKSN